MLTYTVQVNALQSAAEKQIGLDLHRTLPSNTHFRRKGHGVSWHNAILSGNTYATHIL